MSLCTLINNLTTNDIDEKTVQGIKSNINLKLLSKHIRGGISKLSKTTLNDTILNLKSYKKGKYFARGKEIIPDDEQIKIIEAKPDQNIRVIAGAGTGKTTTIACRIKYLLDTYTTPDKILVLTFNVEARKNLEKTIDHLMGFDIKMEIRTIDSFCNKIKLDFNNDTKYYSLSELGTLGRKIMENYGTEISNQYKYVFFDEFQDVNEDQFQILKIFVSHGCKLTVIGDDSQNIYQFRGSDNFYIINFDKILPGATTYKITTNYRSSKEIVNLANDSIKFNRERICKNMKSSTTEKGSIDLTIYGDNGDDIDGIIKKIDYYTTKYHIPYDQIAILSRTTHVLKNVETEFEKAGLPYAALISDQYSNEYKQLIQENKIVISTIHKAKGLEWTVVFIVGVCDSYFPNHMNNGLKNIEEERRLFYVACTRAKRYLHFITNVKEIPLSRFIGEIENHIIIKKETNKMSKKKNIFCGSDEDKKKDNYSVTKIIEMLSGKKIQEMRNLKLIPDILVEKNDLFSNPLQFTDSIKKNVFESDYGIYCDYYLTRQIMIKNKQKIKDIYVESILMNIHLDNDEKNLYRKYELINYFITKKFLIPIESKDIIDVEELIYKISQKLDKSGTEDSDIEKILMMAISDYHYPRFFMNKLEDSYKNYQDKNKKTSDIKESIYYVSLCTKFNNDRRRLVYRNIHDLYEENSVEVLPRIESYVDLIKNDKIICKLQMNKIYKLDMNKYTISMSGEIDYIDITNNTICDIKCSESDYRIEWMIQLLIHYALFMCNSGSGSGSGSESGSGSGPGSGSGSVSKSGPGCCDNEKIKIKNMAVFNIFSGKSYLCKIPKNYDWVSLLDFIGNIISDDLKGIRDKHDISLSIGPPVNINMIVGNENHDVDFDNHSENNNIEDQIQEQVIHLHKINPFHKNNYMILDVENNCVTMDIIQLAYIIYDHNDNEIKRVNKYVKDRFVDKRTKQLTGITTDILRSKGIKFNEIMVEFLQDLNKVTHMGGHHIHTDISKIINNLKKYKILPSFDIFQTLITHDTSSLYKIVGGKNVTLGNMHLELFGVPMVNAHDALSDVAHTAKCYVELRNRIFLNNNPDLVQCDESHENTIICKKSLFRQSPLFQKQIKISNCKLNIDIGLSGILKKNFFN